MNRRIKFPLVAASLVAVGLPIESFAQALPRNTNFSRSSKLRSYLAGGSGNLIGSNSMTSFIGGGQQNEIAHGASHAFVGGGQYNQVYTNWATVAGGSGNRAYGTYSTVAGGYDNVVTNPDTTVGGGHGNKALTNSATVSGGYANTASGIFATVGGGRENTAANENAAVGGGEINTASGVSSTIAGGIDNTATTNYATVGGGEGNDATGSHTTVAGGYANTASGNYATVPGGANAQATHDGSFVWSGDSGEVTQSFGTGTFTVRAEGGVRFYTADGTGVGAFLGPGGSWNAPSDSNLKTKITAVNPRTILSKVAAMPLTEWEYKAVPNRRYIGPMSQDFHAAFGLGDDDKSISTLDSDGVMYAAIQGLVEELKERDKRIAELKAKSGEIDDLKTELRALREEVRGNNLPPDP